MLSRTKKDGKNVLYGEEFFRESVGQGFADKSRIYFVETFVTKVFVVFKGICQQSSGIISADAALFLIKKSHPVILFSFVCFLYSPRFLPHGFTVSAVN